MITLREIDFEVRCGEVFGIAGESGCGKSTLGKSICKLIEPTEGSIVLDGEEISNFVYCHLYDTEEAKKNAKAAENAVTHQ